MKKSVLLAWILAGAAFASELSSVKVAVRAPDGMIEVLSQLDAEESTLVGFRGCANEAPECDVSLRLSAARREATQGDVVTVFVNGSGTADSIRVTRGKSVIRDLGATELPATVEVGALNAGERVQVQVKMGSEMMESSVTAADPRLAAASISASNIRTYVWATPAGKPAGYYQVVDGSNTGGGFVRSAACHTYVCIEGYTDRVSRREYAFSSFQGSGYANRVGWTYDGSGRTYAIGTYLDYVMDDRMVSANPSDDYLYAFADAVRKKIPLGTRP